MQTLLKYWLIPPAINVVLIIIGALLLRRFYKTGLLAIVLSAVLLYLLSTPNIASRLAHSLESHTAVQIDELPKNENIYIVVAGASHFVHAREFGTSSPTTPGLVRLHYAANLHRRTGFPILLTGGPIPNHTEPNASVMARSLELEYKIKAQLLETKSNTTLENALFSAELLKPKGVSKILLVTHSYHMRRAVTLFEHAGFEVIPAPTQLSHHYALDNWLFWMPDAENLQLSASSIYEYIGLVWYGLRLNKPSSDTESVDRSLPIN